MRSSSALPSRRDLLIALLGAPAAMWAGCSRPALPARGELISPDFTIGHRIRDGFRPELAPGQVEEASVVIVGGGIAGLSAAWRLKRAGIDDVVLLDLEATIGGTSRSDSSGDLAFPWGAHYVPAPMKEHRALVTLLKEMNVIVGEHPDGEPKVAEQFLCRDPQERVFVEGQWIEGLYPSLGANEEDRRQLDAFQQALNHWIKRRDESGRRMFAIPIATASDCDEVKALDLLTMSQWMDQQGFTSERLKWLVDYSCRDDYGLSVEQTSAWAGLFYFASRSQRTSEVSQEVITWPEGNGRIVKHLASEVASAIRCSHAVYDIRPVAGSDESSPNVLAWDSSAHRAVGFHADRIIFAAPQFMAPHLMRGFDGWADRGTSDFQYGAWVVANIHLRDRPRERAMPLCWDNVIYQSRSLGYVTSTHQTGRDHGPTVWTWYFPLTDDSGKISRQQLLAMTWSHWADVVVTDLRQAHPDIAPLIARLDIMRWGHAMIQPRPGFVWGKARRQALAPIGRVHFANTDLSGIALLEEAQYHGVRAAEEVLSARGHKFDSML
ncbi:MAG: flavin monoamine oxidase family protein [Planctomycetaceae bacterium]